jgi:excisionase family DNA binding protein
LSNDISPGYLTIEGTASYLGVSKNTVRNMIAAGLLKAVRFTPRVVRINLADLDAAARPVVGGEGTLWTRLA